MYSGSRSVAIGFILTPVYAVERRSASGARIKKSKINNVREPETARTGVVLLSFVAALSITKIAYRFL